MNYIETINAFWNWRMLNRISHAEADLYMGILNIFNSFRRPSSLTIPNSTLVNLCGFSDASQLTKVRNKLVQSGLIKYQKGKNGKAGVYSLCQIDNGFDNKTDNDCDNGFDNDCDNGFDNDFDNINRVKEKTEKEKEYISPLNPPKGDKSVKGTKSKKSTKSEINEVLSRIDNEELRKALYSFSEMRKRLRKPLTARALELLVAKLRTMSVDEGEQTEIVNQSVMHSWQGFYPLHDDGCKEDSCMQSTGDTSGIEAAMVERYST